MSTFGIRVEADRARKPEADLLLEAASRLAQPCLREHVTMPGDPTNLEVPWLDVSGGGRLPPVSCVFRGCGWTGGGCSTDAAYRDDCEHPWDQQLRARVLHAHADQLFEALKPVVVHCQIQGLMWDVYKGALSAQERRCFPIAGFSVERRVLSTLLMYTTTSGSAV